MVIFLFVDVIEYLKLNELSIFDIACINREKRKEFLELLENVTIYDDEIYTRYSFLKYLQLRQIKVLYLIPILADNQFELSIFTKQKQLTYLDISDCKLTLNHLYYILNNCKNIKTLILGFNKNNNVIFSKQEYKTKSQLLTLPLYNNYNNNYSFAFDSYTLHVTEQRFNLENLIIICDNIQYEDCYQIIKKSLNLKVLTIQTRNNNFSPLIYVALLLPYIQEIVIYDNNTQLELVLQLLLQFQLDCNKLKIYSSCPNHTSWNKTVISFSIAGQHHTDDLQSEKIISQPNTSYHQSKPAITIVLQKIIEVHEMQQILQLCPKLIEFEIGEDCDSNDEIIFMNFMKNIIFPQSLKSFTTLYFDKFIIKHLLETVNRLEKIKIIDFNNDLQEIIDFQTLYPNVEFI